MITGCNAQNNSKTSSKDTTGIQQNKPEISWKVNKKFDDKGNLISYDSTAVWSYTSGKSTHNIPADPIWNDSLFYRDFTNSDYFMQKWEQHYFDMGRMIQQMDSFRNSFLNRTYPGLSPMHND